MGSRPHAARASAGAAAWLVGLLAAGAAAGDDPGDSPAMIGFSPAHAREQQAIEQQFDDGLHVAEMQAWMRSFAAAPNHVGSPHDRANAQRILALLRAWGWDADIETFQVLYPTPRRLSLKLLAPGAFSARLREPPLPGDASAARTEGVLPAYNVYGADGEVSGELVYVNYGMAGDYRELERRGISVRQRIVIARYRGGWRGLKVKLAYEHGAAGCILYSDPRDDGYFAGDPYPRGGWRPPEGVQRGSVADITLYSGDPLTPGEAATAQAHRLAPAEARTIMKIPVLPISYADAQPLLAALGGQVAPPGWRGALGLTYHIGPGPARVQLEVASNWRLTPIYDVIARIRGSELPEQWVLRGNHHDAWVFGAWDPLSGHSAMLAEAKAIGALLRSGWRPRRTLIFASWDAEEPGLIGSTEWAELHAEELQRHAVAYLNSDLNGRGFLEANGSHSLQRLVNEVGAGIRDPQTGVSVLARRRAQLRVEAFLDPSAGDQAKRLAQAAATGADLPLGALGSGSDYTPFLQHLGIAALDVGYGGEGDDDGIYHSAYDTYQHYVRFGDPDFGYELAEAQTMGHLELRLADADLLPLQFGDVAEVFAGYVRELHKLAADQNEHAQQLEELRSAQAFELASDPLRPAGPPPAESAVPYLNFVPLEDAVERLKRVARAYDMARVACEAGPTPAAAQRARVDAVLQGLEQVLTSEQGLPGRPWYKHLLYAPGALTGYGAKTMPGIREAIEQQRWDDAARYLTLTAQALESYADQLEAATALLRD